MRHTAYCTSSGTVGPSLSFREGGCGLCGRSSALFADGLATRVGNMVKKADGIEEVAGGQRLRGYQRSGRNYGRQTGRLGDLDLVKAGKSKC